MPFLVSVIIPVFNAAQYVRHAVESALVLAEVGEIILVEDGSKDSSLQICQMLVDENPRVKLFRHEGGANKGAAESRNLGIINSTCPYISFLDSDDYYFKNRFINSKRVFNSSPDVDGLYETVLMINADSGQEKLFGIQDNIQHKQLFRYLLRGGYFHTNAVTLKKDFIMKTGLFNPDLRLHEDVELWLKLAFYGNLLGGSETPPVATYYVRAFSTISGTGRDSKLKLWRSIFKTWFFKKIGFINRLIILKQLVKYYLDNF